MIEMDRVLRPLREAEPAIAQLDTYESPAALTEALRATWHAVDRTLRAFLRSDATAPDSIRLTAMSPDHMSTDDVMLELRRRDFISLGLAGRVHEMRQALERAEAGGVRAADADNASEVVRRIEAEVRGVAGRLRAAADVADPAQDTAGSGRAGTGRDDGPAREGRGTGAAREPESARDRAAPASASGWRTSARSDGPFVHDDPSAKAGWSVALARPLVFIGAMVLLVIAIGVAVVLSGRGSELEQGVAAFSDGRPADAEQHFRAALAEDADNNTARLYLARILRREGRHEEAARLLQAAAAQAPEDAAVRRELGYLFLDLNRPESAAGQFRRAVENDAADPLNWVGLVHALAGSGDSAGAADWLRRAPAEARRMVGER